MEIATGSKEYLQLHFSGKSLRGDWIMDLPKDTEIVIPAGKLGRYVTEIILHARHHRRSHKRDRKSVV